jgi:FlaA1/EpsC-like NDP-sugar epimerase
MKKHIAYLSRRAFERRPWLIGLFEAFLVFCSLILAWLLRFDFSLPHRGLLIISALFLIGIRLGGLRLFNLHRGWWRLSGVNEALDILKAVGLGSVVFYFLMLGLGLRAFPRSVYILEAILTAGLLSGGRLLSRVVAQWARTNAKASKNVILIGAGFAAQMVIREILHSQNGRAVLGCLDDDPTKHGIRLYGVPVLGRVDQLPDILHHYPADEILIAIPSATGEQMRRFIHLCQKVEIPFRTVPALGEMIDGRVSIHQFRDVRLEDLLGREPVRMDLEPLRQRLEGEIVLVTGAAGSIGSELCRQIRRCHPARLVCLDQNETGLFYLHQELTDKASDPSVVSYVADITDEARIVSLFRRELPTIVFHAAAYKHVAMMETNVQEAVKNNVFGLLRLLAVAEQNGCENFVLISSDKAVNPTSVMGVTKRVGELMLSCRNGNSMRCVSVRFGNVLGSNGSVVPIFQKQIDNNLPLTVTHPEIKRFFMTIQEAVALVLSAFCIGQHRDILVLEMGTPVPILQLAKTLIQLSGKSEDQIGIRYTGLRPGEKLTEEIVSSSEVALATEHPKIKRVLGKSAVASVLARQLEELRTSMTLDGGAPVRAKLREIVPEYKYRADDRSPNREIGKVLRAAGSK